jgi:hypothetical protein
LSRVAQQRRAFYLKGMAPGPLYVPVIRGTPRQGRFSEHVAKFVFGKMRKRPELETELIDGASCR